MFANQDVADAVGRDLEPQDDPIRAVVAGVLLASRELRMLVFFPKNLILVWLRFVNCPMCFYFFRHPFSGARPLRCSLVQLVCRQTAVHQVAWPPTMSGFSGVMVVRVCAARAIDNLHLKCART